MAVVTVKALACELPAETGVPLSRWSAPDLAVEAVARGVVESISASTVRRWLASDALKPWQHRSWIFPRDPDFAAKAAQALDLYAGIWDGEPLGENEFVVCADEKTSIQARCRCHPTLPPGKARMMRVEHEYQRKGALQYLAAYDVHRARVIGRTEPTTGIEPFGRLVAQVMTTEPYASAERVFWIVDNGSSHRGRASVTRMSKAWPTAQLVHLPVHASWLNQAEIFFSPAQLDLRRAAELDQAPFGDGTRPDRCARPSGSTPGTTRPSRLGDPLHAPATLITTSYPGTARDRAEWDEVR